MATAEWTRARPSPSGASLQRSSRLGLWRLGHGNGRAEVVLRALAIARALAVTRTTRPRPVVRIVVIYYCCVTRAAPLALSSAVASAHIQWWIRKTSS